MATRLDLRTQARTRLAETVAGLWPDAAINQALGAAHLYVGTHFPGESIDTVAVAAGATTLTPPSGVRDVVAVIDAAGNPIERADTWPLAASTGWRSVSWFVWAGLVRLSRALTDAEAGTWSLYSTVHRTAFPANDVDAVDLDADLVPAVVARACAECLRTLEHDELRRRHMTSQAARSLIADLEEEAEQVLRSRRRVARGVVL